MQHLSASGVLLVWFEDVNTIIGNKLKNLKIFPKSRTVPGENSIIDDDFR